MLSDHPEWATRVREELALSGKENDKESNCLASRIVMETLRLEAERVSHEEGQERDQV